MGRELFDTFYGALIGGAIGDAMGAPVENWHYTDVRRRYGKVSEFLAQPARAVDGNPGQITDDTTVRHVPGHCREGRTDHAGRLRARTARAAQS
jgi:ADP-ribosylglycohydrolase